MTDDRPRGLRIAVVSGVPVYVGASWAIIAVVVAALVGPNLARGYPELGVLAYGAALLFAVMLLVSVLVHEAAHAVAARRAGLPVIRVVADLWGGHTAFEAGSATPGTSAVVAVAGPVANAVLALAAWLLLQVLPVGIPATLAEGTAILNIALAGFNLLPGLPLDGGQLVDAAVWKVTGSRNQGLIAAGWCGRVVTVVVVLWFIVRPVLQGNTSLGLIWSLLIAGFLWTGASAAIQRGSVGQRIDRASLADLVVPVMLVRGTQVLDPELVAALRTQPAVVVDDAGQAVAFATAVDAAQVPEGARSQTPIQAVAVRQHPQWVVDADPAGELDPVLQALVATRASMVAVVYGGRMHGVVTASDVNAALGA